MKTPITLTIRKNNEKAILTELLEKSGLTERAFSEHFGISPKMMSEWLNNKQAVSLVRILRFADQLDFEIQCLIHKK